MMMHWDSNDQFVGGNAHECENPWLLLPPKRQQKTTTACRYCGKRLALEKAGEHLLSCSPEIFAAIAAEYPEPED